MFCNVLWQNLSQYITKEKYKWCYSQHDTSAWNGTKSCAWFDLGQWQSIIINTNNLNNILIKYFLLCFISPNSVVPLTTITDAAITMGMVLLNEAATSKGDVGKRRSKLWQLFVSYDGNIFQAVMCGMSYETKYFCQRI